MNRKISIPGSAIAVIIFVSAVVSIDQQPDAYYPSSCACEEIFEQVVAKIDSNYIAPPLSFTSDDKAQYEQFIASNRGRFSITNMDSCLIRLDSFTRYFQDRHLFIYHGPSYSDEEKLAFREHTKREERSINDLLAATSSNANPLVGIWSDANYEMALVQENADPLKYKLVVTASGRDNWHPGDIKAEIQLIGNRYWAQYRMGDHTPRLREVRLINEGKILRIGTVTLGRRDRENPNARSFQDPRLPSARRIDESTYYISLPSFSIEKSKLDELLKSVKKEIQKTENLIIDIRGNTGGNAIYFDLMALYATQTYKSNQGLVLNSKDNLAYFRRFDELNKGKNDPYAPVVDRLQSTEVGTMVDGPDYRPRSFPKPRKYPAQVAILTNRDNASAAESFILQSKGISDRVITFGENTAGVIDYTSVNLVPVSCKKVGLFLGYPTGTLSKEVHLNGYNELGIEPDVSIPETTANKITFITNYLNRTK